MTCKFKWHSIKCRIWHLCFVSSDPTGYYMSIDHGRILHRTLNKVNGYGVDDRRQAFPFTKFNPALKARRLNGQNVKVVMHFHLGINLITWEVCLHYTLAWYLSTGAPLLHFQQTTICCRTSVKTVPSGSVEYSNLATAR
jgi:hypothetical protein